MNTDTFERAQLKCTEYFLKLKYLRRKIYSRPDAQDIQEYNKTNREWCWFLKEWLLKNKGIDVGDYFVKDFEKSFIVVDNFGLPLQH